MQVRGVMGIALGATLLAAACGGGDKEASTPTATSKAATAASTTQATTAATAAPKASPVATGTATSTATAAPKTEATSAAGAAQTIAIKAIETSDSDYRFDQNALTVKAGSSVTVKLENPGPQRRHSFAVRAVGATDNLVRMNPVEVGQTGELQFTAPAAGAYEFLCTIQGHSDKGMKGTFTVN